MAGPSGRSKRKDSKVEQYKDACPPHKLKDLDALVKSLKGNEAEIMEKIQEWWEEPQTEEPEWADVSKKATKKKQTQPQKGGRGGGPPSGRGGRGFQGGGRAGGGRGSGPERRGGRSDRRPASQPKSPQEPKRDAPPPPPPGPAPVTSAPPAKGAWGQRGGTGAAVAPTQPHQQATPIVSPSPEKVVTPAKLEKVDVGMVAPQDPTPSGMENPVRAAPTGGNVWATKGGSKLIQAEKPKPPPPPPPQQTRSRNRRDMKQSLEPKGMRQPEPPAATALNSGIPSSLTGTPINGGSWKSNGPTLDMPQSTSVAETALGSIGAPEVQEAPPMSSPKPSAPAAPTNVLNMGHWESGEGDDSQNLDFGFGSFGPDNDAPEEPTNSSATPSKEPNSTVSPARPPPGLSIGGMPPMPANAVLVHELENKLEGTTLGGKSVEEPQQGGPKPMTNLPAPAAPPGHPQSSNMAPNVPPGAQSYNTGYGMGMYNYNNAGNGFMAGPPGPALGVPHQKQTGIPQPTPLSTGGAPQHGQPQQGGLYGAAAPSTSGDNANSSNETSTTTGIPPPGMPNAMPYNPALFYGQQPYQMGQPHGQVGYGYGYGQFGNAGFYQQQVMGQSGGYPYDDQPQGRGDYPSKSSNRGYRNNGNQYQNQFNPQAGYGGQPYNMGYNVDHFNQRGGYGPPDPYGMQSGNYGMHDDKKKGGRNNALQQQQQLGGAPQQSQPFLGGAETSASSSGWSSNQAGGGGGGSSNWGGPSWQQGGGN